MKRGLATEFTEDTEKYVRRSDLPLLQLMRDSFQKLSQPNRPPKIQAVSSGQGIGWPAVWDRPVLGDHHPVEFWHRVARRSLSDGCHWIVESTVLILRRSRDGDGLHLTQQSHVGCDRIGAFDKPCEPRILGRIESHGHSH